MSSATTHVKTTVSRAADSKPLELLARAGFIGYGILHLLFAWIALQVAFGGSNQESDQSGALRTLAGTGWGKFLVIAIAVGLVAMAVWQLFEAAVGESGVSSRQAIFERVVSVGRAILYGYLAFTAWKVFQGASASMADSQESKSSGLLASSGGQWWLGLIGLIVAGVGIGIFVYGMRKKFVKHLNTQEMAASVRKSTIRLGMTGYMAKGVAYTIAGILFVVAAITFDPGKARGLDAALKTLASQPYGVWLLGIIAVGIAAFGIYCLAQAKYRKV
jgi:hypothetical protein